MRTFVIFSGKGRTKGDFRDLMQAGRLDIVIHSIINAMFLSNSEREDTVVHIILNGPPDAPKHLEFRHDPDSTLSKKDVGNLIKSALWKCKPGKKVQAFPGVWIEKKSFEKVLEEINNGNIYLLSSNGEDIGKMEIPKDPIFVLGDHEGLPKDQKKFTKKIAKGAISLGPNTYFTSQCITVLNNFVDRAAWNK